MRINQSAVWSEKTANFFIFNCATTRHCWSLQIFYFGQESIVDWWSSTVDKQRNSGFSVKVSDIYALEWLNNRLIDLENFRWFNRDAAVYVGDLYSRCRTNSQLAQLEAAIDVLRCKKKIELNQSCDKKKYSRKSIRQHTNSSQLHSFLNLFNDFRAHTYMFLIMLTIYLIDFLTAYAMGLNIFPFSLSDESSDSWAEVSFNLKWKIFNLWFSFGL